jgi:hypothetical protein
MQSFTSILAITLLTSQVTQLPIDITTHTHTH